MVLRFRRFRLPSAWRFEDSKDGTVCKHSLFLACFLTEISDVFLVVVFGGTCVGSWEVDFAEGPVAFVQYLE